MSIRDGLKEVFRIYDTDFDGYINKLDVIDFANRLEYELKDEHLKLIEIDKVDVDTFLMIFDINIDIGIDKESVRNAFITYDEHKTGKISAAHFIRIANMHVGDLFIDGDVDEILKELDIDDNGYVDYHKLLELIK